MTVTGDRLAPNNQRVHPLSTFDAPRCYRTIEAEEGDVSHASWLLAKRLAGNSRKLAWDRAAAVILAPARASEDERLALRDFFTELDGQDIAAVMRAAGATPRQMAELFHAIDVRQWQAVLWVNQFSSCGETPEMRYWDRFAQGSLRFRNGQLLRPEHLGPG